MAVPRLENLVINFGHPTLDERASMQLTCTPSPTVAARMSAPAMDLEGLGDEIAKLAAHIG
jgi:hypothetical protein